MANDITDRVRAEAALQESEEKYRTLVESSRDGIAVIQDGLVKYVNPRLAEMRGEPVIEIIGQPFDRFVHPDERNRLLERHARRLAGLDEPPSYETVLARKDATRVVCEITTGFVAYEGRRAELVIIRDVSEHKLAEQALQRQLREMTVLKMVATACSEAISVDELIARVTDTIGTALYPDNCGVLVLQHDGTSWHPHPSYLGTTEERLRQVHTLSEGIAGRVMALGRTLHVGDIRREPAYMQATEGVLSELAVPIVVNGKVFGCLNAESKSLNAFTDNDERLLTTVAEGMSTAIEKIRLLQIEKRRREEAEILYNTTRDLVMERDLSRLLQVIVERAAGMVSAPSAAIYLCEPDSRQVRCAVSYNTPADFTGTTLKYGEGAAGTVAGTGQPLVIADYRTWEARTVVFEPEHPFISMLSVPMRWQGDVIGVLQIMDNTSVHPFGSEELRMVNLFANQAAMAVQNARLFRETSQRAQEAAIIADVGRDISETLQLNVTLERIAAHAQELFRARTCAVYVPDPGTTRLRAIAALGPSADEIKAATFNLGSGVLGSIALAQRGEIVNNIGNDPRAVLVPGTVDLPIEHLMGVPVLRRGVLDGLIAIWRVGAGEEFASADLEFLTSLAGQVGVAIQNARLFENLQRSNQELSRAYDTTLEGWARALEMRDKETLGHSRRVTELTLGLARRLGVPESELANIRRGVLLHDIGKMGIPDSLLKKTGPLSDEEWVDMRKHPQYAYDLLHPIAYLRPSLEIPYAHHENWDGSGYPRGLKGTEIPLSARIFTVVDVYDALLYDRPYRRAWPRPQVLDYILQQSGTKFDPAIVDAFLSLVEGPVQVGRDAA
jgi:PAS domain S-box-containing protein